MRQLVGLRLNQLSTAQALVSTARPALATDGVDISSWRAYGSYLDPLAQVFIDTSGAGALTSPSGTEGVEVWGYQPGVNAWYLIGFLNKGNAINLTGAGQGYSEVIQDLGDFTRLAIAATISAGNVTAKFAPMESWTY